MNCFICGKPTKGGSKLCEWHLMYPNKFPIIEEEDHFEDSIYCEIDKVETIGRILSNKYF